MHELSIALSILDLVSEEAERRHGASVKAVHIRLGPLSGVMKQSLLSAYELAREQTPLADCRLVVEEMPITAHCAVCDVDYQVDSIQAMCCPHCGTLAPNVIGGRELEVAALEIEE